MKFAAFTGCIVGCLVVGVRTVDARAQGAGGTAATEVDVTTPEGQEWKFTVVGGAEYQFDTNIDDGDVTLARYGGGLGVQTDLSRDLSISLFTSYTVDLYDFSGTPFGIAPPAEPWDNIHTLTASAIFSLKLSNDWSAFGGPVFQSAREANADFADSITAGGVFGATYTASRDLTIGGGFAVVSQIEEDARFVPIIIVDWRFANDFHLRNTATVNVANRNGFELVYEASKQWEFALGVASQYSRFLLDEDDPAGDGVGEDTAIPFWFRVSYLPTSRVRVDGIFGMNTYGELELTDSDGTGLAETDYDTAFFIGILATLRF